jgi:hypothetical protein
VNGVTELRARIAAALAAEVASRSEWDEPPGLHFLYVEQGKPRLKLQRLPLEFWSVAPPPHVLAMMARAWSFHAPLLSSVAPEGLHGAAFYCESWTVVEPPPGTAEKSELMADWHARRVYTRSDKVQARSIWAVDRDGIAYSAIQRDRLDMAPVAGVHDPRAGESLSGTVIEALGSIVSTLIGTGAGEAR